MLTSEIPVIAMIYPTPSLTTGKREKRQEIEWGLLTGCVYIIIVSTENNHSQLQLNHLYLIRGYVCKHIMHVLYIGNYRVMVSILFKTDWLDEW